MYGTVVSISEGFGFIYSPEAPSVFFNSRSMTGECDFASLAVGDAVVFDAYSTDRGLAAKSVNKSDHATGYQIAERFVVHNYGQPNPWRASEAIVKESVVHLRSRYFSNSQDAQSELIGMVELAGGNFVADCQYDKQPGGDGQYLYSCAAEAGLYVEIVPCEDSDALAAYESVLNAGLELKANLERARIGAVAGISKQFNPGITSKDWIPVVRVAAVLLVVIWVVFF